MRLQRGPWDAGVSKGEGYGWRRVWRCRVRPERAGRKRCPGLYTMMIGVVQTYQSCCSDAHMSMQPATVSAGKAVMRGGG